jgi:hypothetical protein
MRLVLLASGACSADDGSACQPACAADKRECSALAQHSAKLDNSALATMNAPLPKTSYSGDDRIRKRETRAEERRAFENRRMAQVGACDDKYMKCVRSCAGTPSETDPGSVVLKRKDEL